LANTQGREVRIYEDVGRVFERSQDLTVGVEEEFQILAADSLELTSRYDDLKAEADAAFGRELAHSELIQSEVEINSDRCETVAECEVDIVAKRRVLTAAAEGLGLRLGASGVHPFSIWEEQSFIDSPHYRAVVERLQYVAWTNNTFGLHVHVGVRGADRVIALHDALRSYIPTLLALSASSPFARGRATGLHSTRAQLFVRSFPRCGIPDAYRSFADYAEYAQMLYDTGSVTEPTQFWWTIRPHHIYGTLEIRATDAQPLVEDSLALVGLVVALVATLMNRHDEGEQLPLHTGRLLEENRWRAERYGLDGESIDLESGDVVPTVQVVRRLLDDVAPAASRLGVANHLARVEHILNRGNSAQRQLAQYRDGADLLAIHRATVAETMGTAG
jgi:carboxylate-amine ligase